MSGIFPPSAIRTIQRGSTALNSPSASTTATVNAVLAEKSVALITVDADASVTTFTDALVSVIVTNATTLTFARQGTAGSLVVRWQLIEFV
jgi:hypothetical protein